jgi:CRP/FNR family transcriptional regulator, cyclic AMP receptor protein
MIPPKKEERRSRPSPSREPVGRADFQRGDLFQLFMKQPTSRNPPPAATAAPANPLCLLIAKQPFFAGLSPDQFQLLADLAMERQFKAGEHIMREGDPANRFYLILEGKVDLFFESGERGSVPIQVLGPGDDLGWSWLFPPYYFHGTAQAVEPTKTIFFYGTRLRRQCEEDHNLGYEIMKRVAQVAIQTLNASRRNLERVNTKDRASRGGRK